MKELVLSINYMNHVAQIFEAFKYHMVSSLGELLLFRKGGTNIKNVKDLPIIKISDEISRVVIFCMPIILIAAKITTGKNHRWYTNLDKNIEEVSSLLSFIVGYLRDHEYDLHEYSLTDILYLCTTIEIPKELSRISNKISQIK